ncbi:hypothetical protein DY000_02045748 [Brassica cretica]|uniref:Uncharacterized protein n=1 Tax=Brassica cretica TaxID=69181 RepID=A0ABQ7F8X0_BRACR|nr:hypothetical protein DY000_02045748 [Brassica cretica]
MNWVGLGEVEEDDVDDHFFESSNRISTVVPVDLASSSDEESDCWISFSDLPSLALLLPSRTGQRAGAGS